MELKPETSAALSTWLTDTWHTPHPLDWRRFYNFVHQYRENEGYLMDEAGLFQEIMNRLEQDARYSEHLDETIRDRIRIADRILEFLQQTGR